VVCMLVALVADDLALVTLHDLGGGRTQRPHRERRLEQRARGGLRSPARRGAWSARTT
jgi:hypothetical protein